MHVVEARTGCTICMLTAVLPAGPVQQELPGAIFSAVAVTTDTESPHWLVLTSTQTVVLPMAQPKAARSVAPRVIPQAPSASQPLAAVHSQGQGELACSSLLLLCSCSKMFVLQDSVDSVAIKCIVSSSLV